VVGPRLSGMRGAGGHAFVPRRPAPGASPASPSVSTVTAYSSDSAVPRAHIGAYPKRRAVPAAPADVPPAVDEARYADFFAEGASALDPGVAVGGADGLRLG
jgi:hypothetical protein